MHSSSSAPLPPWQRNFGISPPPESVVHLDFTSTVDDCISEECVMYYKHFEYVRLYLLHDLTFEETVCLEHTWLRQLPKEEIASLAEQFAEQRIVTIPNIMLRDDYNSYDINIRNYKAYDFWLHSFYDPTRNSAMFVSANPEYNGTVAWWLGLQHHLRARGDMAYHFKRTDSNVPWHIPKL